MTPPQLSPPNLAPPEGSLYKVLQKLIVNQASGKLIIHNPQDNSIHWRIYLGNGRIHFAGSETGHSERLNYLLGRYVPDKNFSLPGNVADDYQYLCELWKSGEFSFQQIRSILARFTQEALIQILSLKQSLCYFENTVGLEHLLLYLNLKKLMLPVEQQIRHWFTLREEIGSPFQRPRIIDQDKIRQWGEYHFQTETQKIDQFQRFQELLEQQQCLYSLANRANTSTISMALTLQPLIKTGLIEMQPYVLAQNDDRPVVACVDDSPAIQRVVKFTLEASGYRVVNIKEPFKALTTLLHAKPDLILMDINMPEIDGYQLCNLCNKSSALKDIPIIMLTGRSGILDRVKAKMVGSVGYICKPFLPHELVQAINSHVPVNLHSF